ncbi:MAG TPA: hypothetical protein VLA36_12340 [Longimicrobiales bacterium]|nr:hypothetical protein [Longimicrobiales bacterium]
MSASPRPLLTLEPLIEAVRSGVEEGGWTLSGLQKTTSHQFEGRWAGDSTRSAYLFFHRAEGADWASVEAFLDETSRGLTGNLALVVDAIELGGLGEIPRALSDLAGLSAQVMPPSARAPLTLRLHLPSTLTPVDNAETEIRFKLKLPGASLSAGAAGVTVLVADTVRRFNTLLQEQGLRPFLDT